MAARSSEELRRFSGRLLHDVQIFFSVARSLTRIRIGLAEVSWDQETAMIESFGLHARALTDFFFTRKQPAGRGRENDAFAFHFFRPAGQWLELMPAQGPWLRQIRMRASKGGTPAIDRFGSQIAHLSFVETPPSDYARGWPVMQIASELGAVLAVFLDSVDVSVLTPGFTENARREIPVVSRLNADGLLPLAVWTRPAIPRAAT